MGNHLSLRLMKSVCIAVPPFTVQHALCSGFGELALLYSAPRAATVRAETVCSLWVMERTVYAAIKRTFTSQLAAEKRALLDRVPLLHSLSQVLIKSAQLAIPSKERVW